jgi:putative addiction module killer protein
MSDISYNLLVRCTEEFSIWINKLDRSLRIRIDQRIQRYDDGNPGFHKRFDSLIELKWRSGAIGSFRVYCAEVDGVVLLLGGDKGSQNKDIENAKELLIGVKNGTTRINSYE